MFKKFEASEGISGTTQLKSSVQKSIKNRIADDYPLLEPYLSGLVGKKEGGLKLIKCKEHVELLASGTSGEVLFFRQRDGPYVPTLRLLHKFPFILPWQQVDKGAIKFVLSGAQIMCPGLTSPGAAMTPELQPDAVVAVMAEGKSHAVAVGQMKLSTEDVRSKNKGIGIETLHYLNDGLWQTPTA